MLDINKVNTEIESLLDKGSMTWDTMEKLAWLYTVRDHLAMEHGDGMKIGFRGSNKGFDVRSTQGGELEKIESNMTREEIANEFNRHMEDIRTRYPMDYENTVRRMRENYDRRGNYR